jgi:hypothetical protein
VPAICPNGHVFDSGFFIEGVQDATFVGNRSQCPVCGQMGVVPDGIYGATSDTIQVVATSGYSRDQLERIAAVLLRAQSEGAKPKEIAKALSAESPELAELVRRYAPRTSGELAAWIAVLLTLIFGVMQATQSRPRGLTPRQTEQIVEQAVEQAIRETQRTSRPVAPAETRRGGRAAAKQRPKKPPKTYGQRKRKRSR